MNRELANALKFWAYAAPALSSALALIGYLMICRELCGFPAGEKST
jgi:hypothetical protein